MWHKTEERKTPFDFKAISIINKPQNGPFRLHKYTLPLVMLSNYLFALVFAVTFLPHNVLGTEFVIQLKNGYNFNSFFHDYYQSTKVDAESVKKLGLRTFEVGNCKGIFGDFDINMIKALYDDKNVGSISIDRELVLAEVQDNAPKHLARLSQAEHLSATQSLDFIYDATAGIGVDIYVLDTGINSKHTDFEGRVTKLADFTGESSPATDSVGHGTYVAGVIASKTYGVAKKANLFDVKVTNKEGKTKLSSVLSALNLILHDSKITKRPSLVVIPLIMKKNAILNGAVEALVKEGIPVISPAGNEGRQACNYSPASAKGSLTVGAIDPETDAIATFSNWGACVDVFAPGVKLQTTGRSHNETAIKSGTSLSTGVAAGLVAYFMGMGDSGSQAVERVVKYALNGAIPEANFHQKPLTANRLLFNGEGEPNWGISP